MSLRELYQEIIIDHARSPRNFGKLDLANHTQVGHNPLCGDKITIYLDVQNDSIKDIQFEGNGCAISLASASLMTEALKEKTLEEVNELFVQFHTLVTKCDCNDLDLGKLSVFSGVAEFPARVKCAVLAWHTLRAAINDEKNAVSTE